MRKKIITLVISLIMVLGVIFGAGCAGGGPFTVTFVGGADDAYIYIGETEQTVNSSDQIIEPVFVRPGYNFIGWDRHISSIRDNTTVKALWTQYEFTITFEGAGAVDEQGKGTITQKVNSGIDIVPPEFIKTGYDLSWDKDFPTITESCTVTAVWTPKTYTISFLDEDGSDLGLADLEVKYDSVIEGLPTLPDKEDGGDLTRFVRWEIKYDEGLPNGTLINGGVWKFTSNITVYARWAEDSYLIEYDLQGGNIINNPVSYSYGDDTIAINNPNKLGYDFVGWTGTDLDEPTTNLTIEKGELGDKLFFANWRAKTYTITLNASGGSFDEGVSNKINVTFDAVVGSLPAPTLAGYAFVGWRLSSSNKEINAESIWTLDSTDELVAQYKRVYTIKFSLEADVVLGIIDGKREVVTATCNLLDKNDLDIPEGTSLNDFTLTIMEGQSLRDLGINQFPKVDPIDEGMNDYKYSGYWGYAYAKGRIRDINPDTVFNEENFTVISEDGVILLQPHCTSLWFAS